MEVRLDMPRQFRACPFRDSDTTCNLLVFLVNTGKRPGGSNAICGRDAPADNCPARPGAVTVEAGF